MSRGPITLLDGASFCIAAEGGDLQRGGQHGLFFLDARILSELVVTVNGEAPEALADHVDAPHQATFVGRCPGSALVLERVRQVGSGMRDDLIVRNVGGEPAYCRVELRIAADFADPTDVRDGREREAEVSAGVDGAALVISQRRGRLGVRVELVSGDRKPAVVEPEMIAYEAIVPAGGAWRLCAEVIPVVDGDQIEPRHRSGDPIERTETTDRLARWRRSLPRVTSDHPHLPAVFARSVDDLGSLRVFDPEVPERAVVAAGVPWQMSLHARDALLTAWSALLVDPGLALGVLETLARFQGTDVDPRTEEEPGRILHELRFGSGPSLGFGGGRISYGAVDSTPLFVMLLGELRRWGLAPELIERLLPHADAALTWIEDHGDRDGDGWVEYQRATDRGRRHQGWRDTDEGLRAADGRMGQPPIALAEVQASVYAAYVARSHFAREAGDQAGEASWRAKADDVRARFRRDFWLEGTGSVALALDHEKRPLDAMGSHLGWCLWTGILEFDQAAAVAKHLLSPDLFTGWGVRSLAMSTVGSSPLGYHHGAVWPHDTAIAAAGLMRYGFVDEALRLVSGLLDAAVAFDGRLPEVFAGFDSADLGFPVRLPGACSPSAWAAASTLLSLRTILRFDPWVPAGLIRVAPVLPPGTTRLRMTDIPLLGGQLTVTVDGDALEVDGVPPGMTVEREARPPLGGHGR